MVDPASVRRILVRANNWIGDVVMISPAIRALRERFSSAEIVILARPWVCDALGANPHFDRLLPYEIPGRHAGLSGKVRLVRELRRERFDLAVLFQKAFEAALLSAAAGIPVRVGHATDRRGWLLTDRVPVPPGSDRMHHVDFFLQVAEACGARAPSRTPFFSISEEDRSWAREFLAGAGTVSGFVAIHPGGSKAPRAWHADRFAALAARLQAGRGLTPLVVGDGSDLEAAAAIAAAAPRTLVAAGRTTVRQMAALIENARLFVGSDSGPMHIAGAVGTPGVGVFGPGLPEKTAPRTAGGGFEAVTMRVACSPCRQDFFRECNPAPSGKPECLEGISVDRVFEACERVLLATAR